PVDAADHGGFSGAGRPADHDTLAAHHLEIDVAQHMEIAVPFIDLREFDRDRRVELAWLHAGRINIEPRRHTYRPRQDGLPSRARSATWRSRTRGRTWRRPHSRWS